MSIESIVEAFARGLAQGFAQSEQTTLAKAQSGNGRRTRHSRRSRLRQEVVPQNEPPPDAPQIVFDQPEIIAPPFTQAQVEAMERKLRGENPQDTYVPGEGVAPWQGS